jgi:hypothetical protein
MQAVKEFTEKVLKRFQASTKQLKTHLLKHEYYEGIELIQTTLNEIDQVNMEANLKVLQ